MSDEIIDANNFLNNEEISTASYSNINTLGLHICDINNYVDNKPDFKDDSQINTKVIPKYGFFLDANPTAIIKPKSITKILDEYLAENNLTFKDVQDEVFDWCERKIKGE